MRTRLYTPEDYRLIELWWLGHKTMVVPQALLPKLGVVVLSEEGHPIAVAWTYLGLEVGVAWMAWVTTNPALKPAQSVKALKVLVGGVEAALPLEYGVIFTESKSPSVVRFMKRQGYTVNHAATQLFKGIKR